MAARFDLEMKIAVLATIVVRVKHVVCIEDLTHSGLTRVKIQP